MHTTPGRDRTIPISQYTVLHVALMAGVVTFAGVAAFLGPSMAEDAAGDDPLGPLKWIPVGLLAVALPAAPFLRGLLARRVIPRRDEVLGQVREGRLCQELVQANLMPAAVVEGAGLLGAAFTLVTGELWLLACPALAVAFLAWLLPTRENQRRLVESV